MNWTISQTVDLANGYTPIVWPNALMVSGDVGAHTWEVTVLENGVAVDLTGATLTGNFLRADGNTVQVSGGVSGNVASVTLTDVCYAVEGKLMGSMKLIKAGVTITLCAVIFTVKLLTSGDVIDPGIAYQDFTIDASPAGTYADLAALISADPDHDKIYITLDDGNWCYHNGSTFVAGGVYQAASVTASEVSTSVDGVSVQSALDSKPDLDKFILDVSKNLYNSADKQAGALNASGEITNNTDYSTTGFIEVKQGKYLVSSLGGIPQSMRFICLYDTNRNPVGNPVDYRIQNKTSQIISVEGAVYARITMQNEAFISSLMIELNDDGIPTEFTEYFTPVYDFADYGVTTLKSTAERIDERLILTDGSRNLYNASEMQSGVLYSNGLIRPNTDYSTTGYIAAEEGKYLVTSDGLVPISMRFVVEYDTDKNPIGNPVDYRKQNLTSLLIGPGVAYVRITSENATFAGSLMIEMSDTSSSISFDEYIRPDYDFKGRRVGILEDRVADAEIKAVTLTRNINRAHFGWIDDDAKIYFYDYLYPWAVTNSVPITAAVITQNAETGGTGWMTIANLLAMQTDHPELITFASHTRNHAYVNDVSYTTAQLEEQYRGSLDDLESWGISTNLMVYPGGQLNDAALEIIRKYYRYGFLAGKGEDETAGSRLNSPPIGTFRILRRKMAQLSNVDTIKAEIDLAINNKSMMIFITHVQSSTSGNTDVEAEFAVYDEVLEYIRDKGYDIEPVSSICGIYRNALELGQWSSVESVEGYFVIDANGNITSDAEGNRQVYQTLARVIDLEARVQALEDAE